MRNLMKAVAILALLVTIAAAGAILYGLHTLAPEVVSVNVTKTPAMQAQSLFDNTMEQLKEGSFVGRRYTEETDFAIENCEFVTYSVRLTNKGFFPAEWITLTVSPAQGAQGQDIVQLGDTGAYVLTSGSTGDLNATVLTSLKEQQAPRLLNVECYVFGQKLAFGMQAQE